MHFCERKVYFELLYAKCMPILAVETKIHCNQFRQLHVSLAKNIERERWNIFLLDCNTYIAVLYMHVVQVTKMPCFYLHSLLHG